ncbi:MAG: MaoC family dehydratase, partial [Rhodoblastus sp.]|nr:MaoC family dehydratase [Rhodoblastus sp.]
MTATPFNAARPKTSLAEIEASVGKEVGVSKWFTIDQALITAFGKLTQDEYFIHMDPVRAAKETPFGGSIAHGFLTLSMMSAMAYDALPEVEGRTMGMNYGFDKIRFLSPVPAGSKVRGHFVISAVEKKS